MMWPKQHQMIPFGGSRYNMLFSQRINGKQCNLTLLCPLLMPCSKICSTNLDNKDHSFTMKTWRLRHLNKLPKATDIIYAEDGFRIDIWGPRLGSVLELIYTDYKIFRGAETRTEVSEKWFRKPDWHPAADGRVRECTLLYLAVSRHPPSSATASSLPLRMTAWLMSFCS